MEFNFLDSIKNAKDEKVLLNSFIDAIDELREKIDERLNEINISKNDKGELYYVYAYTPSDVYITKQKSNKVEKLEGVSDEFKRNLAEGFILRYKDGKYLIDEMLTEKSMNFELDFDNYKEFER